MHSHIVGKTLNELTFKTCKRILDEGTDIPSRNGASKELCDISLFLEDPRARHLYLQGRTNNIYGTLGEIFWLLAGKTEISPVLEKFVPRASNYSDDGISWRAGYGDRMFVYDQIDHVIQMFLKDGKNTRRAVMAIWQPQKDTLKAVQEQGFQDSKDYPCSNFLWFWIRDNKLHSKLGMRSNDWIFGGSNINLVEFTILQELILALLKQSNLTEFSDVELGYYHHSVVSLHLYDATIKQAEKIVEAGCVNEKNFESTGTYPIILYGDYANMRGLFNDIYLRFCHIATEANPTWMDMYEIFQNHGITTTGNQLFNYALLAEAYLMHLTGKKVDFQKTVLPYLKGCLLAAVMYNKFTPAEWLQT